MYIIVKKFVTYSLVIVILFSLTEFHEFAKIPFAIGHFIEHYSENSDTTVFDFLYEHYSKNDTNNSAHQSLPFKSHCHSNSSQIQLFSELLLLDIFVPFSKINYSSFTTTTTLLGIKLVVWQPPQNSSHI